MSPRVQAQTIQKRFRTPRIPFLLSRFDDDRKALAKGVLLFDQSFFITHLGKLTDLFRIVVFKIAFSILYLFSNIGFLAGVFLWPAPPARGGAKKGEKTKC